MTPDELLTMAHDELRQSVYWSARARQIKSGPLGAGSESYVAAVQMSARALGRFDVYSRIAQGEWTELSLIAVEAGLTHE